jgi:tRNA C32,U32 (ribose-2'-O)-methylase TrmJ
VTMAQAITRQIYVVLVRPIYPRNMGMCTRALANMQGTQVLFIAPQADPHSDEGKQGAAGAQESLRSSKVFASWDDFHKEHGGGLRIALSARNLRGETAERLDVKLESLMAEKKTLLTQDDTPIYLFFGPEDDGLSFQDIELANHVCALPTGNEFTSLNLSHAVLLTLYIVQKSLGQLQASPKLAASADQVAQAPSRHPAYFPQKTIEDWVSAVGFDLSKQRVNAAKTFQRILLENQPTDDELRVLEAVLQQNIRKLRGK